MTSTSPLSLQLPTFPAGLPACTLCTKHLLYVPDPHCPTLTVQTLPQGKGRGKVAEPDPGTGIFPHLDFAGVLATGHCIDTLQKSPDPLVLATSFVCLFIKHADFNRNFNHYFYFIKFVLFSLHNVITVIKTLVPLGRISNNSFCEVSKVE